MTQTHPKFSVCIPAYNRASVLPELLESILSQDFGSFEVVINEDGSPERPAIREVVERYSSLHSGLIRYFENEHNLGFDANLRSLIERSRGDYCVFMGNDDLMCPGALRVIGDVISRHPRIGVFLRSYAAFDDEPGNIAQTFRYFDREIFFPAGADAVGTLYRRSVVIPGVTLNREAAMRYATDRFDGTLLYQIYLVANILVDWNGAFSPEIVTLYRNGGVPDFGNSAAEKGRFVPRTRTTESSIHFMRGMLDIARYVDDMRGIAIYKKILKDISNYSYPVLAVQAEKPFREFFGYYIALIKLGFGRSFLFHAYFFLILFFGTRRVENLIAGIKRRLGYTPVLGSVYTGVEKQKH